MLKYWKLIVNLNVVIGVVVRLVKWLWMLIYIFVIRMGEGFSLFFFN